MAQDNYEAMMGAINNTIAYLEGKEKAFTTLGINIPLLNINLLQELSSIIEMVLIFNNATSTGGELIDIDKARHYRSNFTGKFGNPDNPAAIFKKRMVKVSAKLLKTVLDQQDKAGAIIPIEFIQILV